MLMLIGHGAAVLRKPEHGRNMDYQAGADEAWQFWGGYLHFKVSAGEAWNSGLVLNFQG